MNFGLIPIVYNVEGDLKFPDNLPCQTVTLHKGFNNVIDSINSSIACISADSVPAHLSNYYRVPVFVCTKVNNIKYLPLSSYRLGHWSTFDEIESSPFRLLSFLNNIINWFRNYVLFYK